MHHFLALLVGILVSIMVAANGGLSEIYGVHAASVLIHTVGLVLITSIALLKRDRLFAKGRPWYLYLGGAIGVMTVLFTNIPFGRISVSAILALGLFGQGVLSLIVDQYGLLGMPKHQFHKRKLLGLALVLAGIVSMITSFEIVAVLLAFIAGASIVISRTLNAKLAELTSVRISTFFNYFVGLTVASFVYLLFGRNELGFSAALNFSSSWFLYTGGALGVLMIALTNILVVKISAFYLSLLLFMGQVAAGILIDIFLTGVFSTRNLIGGVLITLGLFTDLLIEKRSAAVQNK